MISNLYRVKIHSTGCLPNQRWKKGEGSFLPVDNRLRVCAKAMSQFREEPQSLLESTFDLLGKIQSHPQHSPQKRMSNRATRSTWFSLIVEDSRATSGCSSRHLVGGTHLGQLRCVCRVRSGSHKIDGWVLTMERLWKDRQEDCVVMPSRSLRWSLNGQLWR